MWLLLTNFCKDLPHLLHLLFCYLSRHFSVIDQTRSVRWDYRKDKSKESRVGSWSDRCDLTENTPSSASCKLPFSPTTYPGCCSLLTFQPVRGYELPLTHVTATVGCKNLSKTSCMHLLTDPCWSPPLLTISTVLFSSFPFPCTSLYNNQSNFLLLPLYGSKPAL